MVTKYTPDAITLNLTGLQTSDDTLTALAAYNTNGLITQTAADTFTGRTITAGTGVSITNGSGVSGNPTVALAAGCITQVQSTTLTTTVTLSHTASTGFADISGLSVSITPSSTSSKILVLCSVTLGCGATSITQLCQIVRDSTPIGIGTGVSSRTAITSGTVVSGTDEDIHQLGFHHLDTPSTTSAITYKVQMTQKSTGSSVDMYVNRTATDTDNSAYSRGISNITVIEILG